MNEYAITITTTKFGPRTEQFIIEARSAGMAVDDAMKKMGLDFISITDREKATYTIHKV